MLQIQSKIWFPNSPSLEYSEDETHHRMNDNSASWVGNVDIAKEREAFGLIFKEVARLRVAPMWHLWSQGRLIETLRRNVNWAAPAMRSHQTMGQVYLMVSEFYPVECRHKWPPIAFQKPLTLSAFDTVFPDPKSTSLCCLRTPIVVSPTLPTLCVGDGADSYFPPLNRQMAPEMTFYSKGAALE